MLHILSITTSKPGHLARLSQALSKGLWPVSQASIQRFKGAWTSDFGELNKLYTLYEFEDLDTYTRAEIESKKQLPPQDADDSFDAGAVRTETLVLSAQHHINRPPDDSAMYDFRIYDIRHSYTAQYLDLLREVLPIRQTHSKPFCIWTPLAGTLDQIVHMWPYDSIEHRDAVRARVAQEPRWGAFVDQVFPLLVQQRSSLLRPVRDCTWLNRRAR